MELSCPPTLSLPDLLPNRTPFTRSPASLLLPRLRPLVFVSKSGLRCRASKETSTFVSRFERSPNDSTVDKVEEIQGEETENGKEEGRVVDEEQSKHIEFLKKLDLKLDSDDSYIILIYGTGALVALWLSFAVVGAIDSIPLFPKMMEVVGLAYTVWFSYRYLIFKENREELFAKIEDIKKRIIGTSEG